MVRSSGGRSFQSRGAVIDMARLENMRGEVTGGRERVRQDDDRVERVGWMVKSSRLLANPCTTTSPLILHCLGPKKTENRINESCKVSLLLHGLKVRETFADWTILALLTQDPTNCWFAKFCMT